MRIALRRPRLCVPKQPANQWQAQPAAGTGGREGVSQIVDAHAG